MKKEIDLHAVKREAEAKKISPFVIIKRKLNYRQQNQRDEITDHCCGSCRMRCEAVYDAVKKIQCHWIGVSPDVESEIEDNHVCNWFERGYNY